jgi:hypothetical protein
MKTIAKLLPILLIVLPFSAGATSMYDDSSAEVKVNVGAGVSGSSQGSGGSSSGSTQTGTTKVEDSAHTEDSIRLDGTRSSDDGSIEVEVEHGVEVENEIHGDPDFDLFVQTVKEGDKNVVAADADGDDAVEVEYKHQAHLFGFIPVTLNSKTRLASSPGGGMPVVKVSLPWWSFLVSDASDIRSSIEASLSANAELQADAATRESSSGMSTGRRSKLVEVMVSSLAEVETAIKAGYNVKANVK